MELSTFQNQQTNYYYLPPEAWLLVFDSIQDPNDFWACLKSNTNMDHALRVSTSLWTSIHLYKILPLLYHMLGTNDLLKLRLICKRWKNVMDCFIERDQINIACAITSRWKFGFRSVVDSQKLKLNVTNKVCYGEINSSLYYEKTLAQLCPSSTALTSICVPDSCPQEDSSTFVNLISFFYENGAFLKHLCFHLRRLPDYNFFLYFQHLLEFTPNLETLSVVELVYPIQENDFPLAQQENTLPVLQNLRLLEIGNIPKQISEYIMNGLVQSPKLSKLRICVESKKAILPLRSCSAPIEELDLQLKSSAMDVFQLLKVTEHFGNTLKVLSIHFQFDFNLNKNLRLQLPNLETLNLSVIGNYIPFSCFLDLVKLQRLTFHRHDSFKTVSEDEYIFDTFWDAEIIVAKYAVSISKLWERFPNLKTLVISGNSRTDRIFTKCNIINLRNKPLRLMYYKARYSMKVNLDSFFKSLSICARAGLFEFKGFKIIFALLGAGCWIFLGITWAVVFMILGLILFVYLVWNSQPVELQGNRNTCV